MVTMASATYQDSPADATRAAAVWQTYKRRVTMAAYRLEDSPSQILAGFGKWRRMTVCPRTGAEGGNDE